jgi:hypothetical protein
MNERSLFQFAYVPTLMPSRGEPVGGVPVGGVGVGVGAGGRRVPPDMLRELPTLSLVVDLLSRATPPATSATVDEAANMVRVDTALETTLLEDFIGPALTHTHPISRGRSTTVPNGG